MDIFLFFFAQSQPKGNWLLQMLTQQTIKIWKKVKRFNLKNETTCSEETEKLGYLWVGKCTGGRLGRIHMMFSFRSIIFQIMARNKTNSKKTASSLRLNSKIPFCYSKQLNMLKTKYFYMADFEKTNLYRRFVSFHVCLKQQTKQTSVDHSGKLSVYKGRGNKTNA